MSSQTEDNFIGARWHVEFVIARLISCGRAQRIAAEFDCGGLSERQIIYMAVQFHFPSRLRISTLTLLQALPELLCDLNSALNYNERKFCGRRAS